MTSRFFPVLALSSCKTSSGGKQAWSRITVSITCSNELHVWLPPCINSYINNTVDNNADRSNSNSMDIVKCNNTNHNQNAAFNRNDALTTKEATTITMTTTENISDNDNNDNKKVSTNYAKVQRQQQWHHQK